MTGDLFTFIDITKPDATGLSDHERAMLDFLKWLGRPHECPFAWLSELNDCSLAFWREGAAVLSELLTHAQTILQRKESEANLECQQRRGGQSPVTPVIGEMCEK